MFIDEITLLGYRAMAAAIAIAMAVFVLRSQDWRAQVYASLVFVPFALRALGMK